MDPRSGKFFDPAKATFIAQLGLKHFFDAFALEHQRDIRVDAAHALELDVEDILPTFAVKQEVAQEFKLTSVPLPVDPPAKKAKKMKNEESLNDAAETMGDVNMDKESSPESGSDSSDSNSDFSSEDGSSDVSDLDKFEEAFQEFGNLRAGVDPTSLDSQPVTQMMMLLDCHWKVDSPRCNRWLMYPRPGHWHASLLRQVLDHPTKVLYDPETEVLFLLQFWQVQWLVWLYELDEHPVRLVPCQLGPIRCRSYQQAQPEVAATASYS